jgi:hypothetical protein
LSTGQVILTDYLVEHITKGIRARGMLLASLEKADVIAFLKENLHWRITDVSFTLCDILELGDTEGMWLIMLDTD